MILSFIFTFLLLGALIGSFIFLVWLLVYSITDCWYPFKWYYEYHKESNDTISYRSLVRDGYYSITEYVQISELPRLTFQQFKNFYLLKSESWTLCTCYVYKNHDVSLSFTFSYRDWIKYSKFTKRIANEKEHAKLSKEKQEREKANNETTLRLLKLVQQDIDFAKAESQKKFMEVADLVNNIQR